MIRTRLNDALKAAQKENDKCSVSTLRLITAALKDRDIGARFKGTMDGIDEDEVLGLLQSMVNQRRESIKLYEKGGRMELAQQEAEEIAVIQRFLPEQLTADEISEAIQGVIDEVGAASLKEIGMVMGALKERYAGRMDFGKASAMVKGRLG